MKLKKENIIINFDKVCGWCMNTKPVDEFYKHRTKGYQKICKSCYPEYHRSYRYKQPLGDKDVIDFIIGEVIDESSISFESYAKLIGKVMSKFNLRLPEACKVVKLNLNFMEIEFKTYDKSLSRTKSYITFKHLVGLR